MWLLERVRRRLPRAGATRASLRAATFGAVVAVALGAAVYTSPERALALAEATAADPLAFGLVVLALYLVRPVLLWPATVVAVAVGYGFGPVLGLPIALAGAVLTSAPPFVVARRLGRDAPVVGSAQAVGERFFETAGPVRGVAAGRLVPVPADAVTCAAAIAGVRFRHFALGVVVGELPWTIAGVAAGSSVATLTTDGVAAGGVRVAALATVAGLALLVGPAYRRYGAPTGDPGAGS